MSDDRQSIFGLIGLCVRAGALRIGREQAARHRNRLLGVLVSGDLSAGSRQEVRRDFADVPILQASCSSADIEQHTGLRNAKVLGIVRSDIGRNLWQRLEAADWVRVLQRPRTDDSASPRTSSGPGPARKKTRKGRKRARTKERHRPDSVS